MRVWLPDRPGALGQVASRIGAVRGGIVGIEILERSDTVAVDELFVELPDGTPLKLLIEEIRQVDGVEVEDVHALPGGPYDPSTTVLESAAALVAVTDVDKLLDVVVEHTARVLRATWVAVVDLEGGTILASEGTCPPAPWLAAFLHGSASSTEVASGAAGPDDIVWAPLPVAGAALVVGRDTSVYRSRERRQAAALASIADTRLEELRSTS